jgi:hypothetical protein
MPYRREFLFPQIWFISFYHMLTSFVKFRRIDDLTLRLPVVKHLAGACMEI